MAFEITVPEALAILGVTRAELKLLIEMGELKEVVVRDREDKVVRKALRRREVTELAKRIERCRQAPTLERRTSRPKPAVVRDRSKPAVAPELLGPMVAARLLDVSLPAFHALVSEGQLRVAPTTGRNHFRFYRKDVIALVAARNASHCRRPSKGGRTPADALVDVPSAALLLHTTPARVYGLINRGVLEVVHVSADGARCLRRQEVVALVGLRTEA